MDGRLVRGPDFAAVLRSNATDAGLPVRLLSAIRSRTRWETAVYGRVRWSSEVFTGVKRIAEATFLE